MIDYSKLKHVQRTRASHRFIVLTSCLLITARLLLNENIVRASTAIPNSSRIENMPVYAQQRNLSCEYAATRSAVARWGVQISEAEFIAAIPENPNPHLGFRGNINGVWGGTTDYGIYPEPLARYLGTRGFNTKLLWGGTEMLKQEINLGRPVVVWIADFPSYEPFESFVNDQSFTLIPYEHSVTIYGYDEGGVLVADPGFGIYDYYPWSTFIHSWGHLNNMAMSIWPNSNQPQVQNSREVPGISPAFYRYWMQEGGLEILGRPLGVPYNQGGKTIQYFERTRLEYDNTQPQSSTVAKSLLGRELTITRQSETAFRPLDTQEIKTLNEAEKTKFFSQTGFAIGPSFEEFWQNKGALGRFGYPISRPFYENGTVVQYFERARLELHFYSSDSSPTIQLGLLGREQLSSSD